ncbi:MAG: LIC_12708 family protein, partial [Salinispira sp.]
MSKFLIYAAVYLLFLTISCNRAAVSGEVLPGEFLFSLDIGVLENEIDLFHRGGTLPEERNSVFMYRGIIFIANSLGNKIMEFSSYGDLISLIYNAEENPRPLLLSSSPREGNIVNKAAHSFPFRNIGEISVSSENVLLVTDTAAPGQEGFDLETGAAFQHIIHRFTSEGDYLDYIGQEGVGGTPFSFIVSMNVTARNELV